MDLIRSWDEFRVPKLQKVTLLPEYYYSYRCDDRPEIKWMAVVVLLNGKDSHPENNTRYKMVHVHGEHYCP